MIDFIPSAVLAGTVAGGFSAASTYSYARDHFKQARVQRLTREWEATRPERSQDISYVPRELYIDPQFREMATEFQRVTQRSVEPIGLELRLTR